MLSRSVLLGLSALAASAASTTLSSSADGLFQRASTCAANQSRCPASFPSNFCCAADRQCVPLAGNTTILCCPKDASCDVIKSISCDLSLQDADSHPDGEVKTTALNGALPRCGDGTCCPFGYSCSATRGICVIDKNQNAAPLQSSAPTSTAAPTATTSATVTTASPPPPAGTSQGIQVSPGAANTSEAATQGPARGGTSRAVIAGASVASALVGLGLVLAGILFVKRRSSRRRSRSLREPDTLRLTRSTSSFGNIISNPIVANNNTWRTDFARKSPEGSALDSGIGSISKRSIGSASSGGDTHYYGPTTPPPTHSRDPDTSRPAVRIPPIRNMARQSSIAYGYAAPDTSPYSETDNYHARFNDPPSYLQKQPSKKKQQEERWRPPPHPRTPEQQRELSGVSINVFADPHTVESSLQVPNAPGLGGGGSSGTSSRRFSHMTTFSDMLRSADLGGFNRGEPYVPHTPDHLGSPWRRRP